MSDPLEYRDRPVSREAGREIFTETGIGDPYGAGIALPLLLALVRSRPATFGGDMGAMADRFGMLRREKATKDDLPIGMHETRDPNTGVSFVMMNCALCHTERLRTGSGESLAVGIGNRRIRIHAYERALLSAAMDPALDEAGLLREADAIAVSARLSWPTDVGAAIVRATLGEWRKRAASRLSVVEALAEGLPGRVATIESFTLAMNARGHHLPIPAVPGFTRVPDVRSFRYRESLSYDGVGVGSPTVLVAEADFAFGVRTEWYESHRHLGTSLYMFLRHFERDLRFPGAVDRGLAEQGRGVFGMACARCHGTYGRSGGHASLDYDESVVPLASIGTDAARANAVTDAFVVAANEDVATKGLVHTRRTQGYVPPPLIDVWARGPFGHNGQWPTLAVMAEKPEKRPTRFRVEPDAAYDLEGVGTAWAAGEGKAGSASSYVFDAARPGHSVLGHSYLSDLPASEARAVIEYLKTL